MKRVLLGDRSACSPLPVRCWRPAKRAARLISSTSHRGKQYLSRLWRHFASYRVAPYEAANVLTGELKGADYPEGFQRITAVMVNNTVAAHPQRGLV